MFWIRLLLYKFICGMNDGYGVVIRKMGVSIRTIPFASLVFGMSMIVRWKLDFVASGFNLKCNKVRWKRN